MYNQVIEKAKKEELKKKEENEQYYNPLKENTKRVIKYLDTLNLQHKIIWSGWFIHIEINLVENTKSSYLKSHIRVKPFHLEYCTGHYSVNRMSPVNNVASDTIIVDDINKLKNLILIDMTESLKFAL